MEGSSSPSSEAITYTRDKLNEAKYFFEMLSQVQEEPDKFYYNLSAFLTAWRSVLDVMLYDFAEYYSLGFSRDVDMTHKEFFAVAKALTKTEAMKFIEWWRKKQGMLSNSPFWKKRRIVVHRGYPAMTQTYTFYVSGSGGTSGTLSPYLTPVGLPSESTLGTLVPRTLTVPTGTPSVWKFEDFPNENAIDMCQKAYGEMKKIVEEAEKLFGIKFSVNL
jgi:hypothetical protein